MEAAKTIYEGDRRCDDVDYYSSFNEGDGIPKKPHSYAQRVRERVGPFDELASYALAANVTRVAIRVAVERLTYYFGIELGNKGRIFGFCRSMLSFIIWGKVREILCTKYKI